MDKSPGPDQIQNELLKGTMEEVSPVLGSVFNEILYIEVIPKQWWESHIILIHKKGAKDEIGNYRPISLMSNVYKVFAKLILGRIETMLDENQPNEQAGFRKNFSTIDHIHTVKQVLEKYKEYNKPLYIAFIDFAKAFDSLYHCKIWTSLKQQGVSSTYINIIKSIYRSSKARIRLEALGNEFPINRGVRQGDPLSPKLFSAALESIFRNLDWDENGLKINGRMLNHLRFADDIVLFEECPLKMQSMIEELATESRTFGLSMNDTKTKLMTNGVETPISVKGEALEYVKDYTYLGQIISPEDQTTKETNRRIAIGWRKYWSLKEIMKSKDLSLSIKTRVFSTCILPCLTYGCETWALNKSHRESFEKCQRAMERSMLGIRKIDKIRNSIIREKTGVVNITTRMDQLKWRWTGHMLRDTQGKWSNLVTQWYPRDGKRKKGKQQRRWEDDLKLTAGPYWKRAAQDRKHWRELEEAFARRHLELRDII